MMFKDKIEMKFYLNTIKLLTINKHQLLLKILYQIPNLNEKPEALPEMNNNKDLQIMFSKKKNE